MTRSASLWHFPRYYHSLRVSLVHFLRPNSWKSCNLKRLTLIREKQHERDKWIYNDCQSRYGTSPVQDELQTNIAKFSEKGSSEKLTLLKRSFFEMLCWTGELFVDRGDHGVRLYKTKNEVSTREPYNEFVLFSKYLQIWSEKENGSESCEFFWNDDKVIP